MLHMELCLYVCSRAKCLGFFHGEMCVSTQRYRSLHVHHSFFDVVASADQATLSSTHPQPAGPAAVWRCWLLGACRRRGVLRQPGWWPSELARHWYAGRLGGVRCGEAPALGSREKWLSFSYPTVGVHDDHESVAPVPVLYVHAPPFQLCAQGIQDLAVERDEHEAVARLVGPFRRQNEFAAGPRHLRHPCLSTFLVAPVLDQSELLPG